MLDIKTKNVSVPKGQATFDRNIDTDIDNDNYRYWTENTETKSITIAITIMEDIGIDNCR